MQSNNISKIVQWWMTPKLPREHIFIKPEARPKVFKKIIKVYFRKWIVHPIKRRGAKYYLSILQKYFGIKVIAITGSAGKTSTKDMLASILSLDGETVSSYKNIDPVYNIPTTIFRCKFSTKYLVLEMGVEYPNEMDYYLWLAQPDIGIITNVYPTHTQFFGDIEGVGREKIKLVEGLSKEGCAILNNENEYLCKHFSKIISEIIWFGGRGGVRAVKCRLTNDLQTKFTLVIGRSKIIVQPPMLGSQFVSNSLAAASVSHKLGISLTKIKKGLEKYVKPEHRMNLIKLSSGALLIDDSYNNNPEAAKRAIDTLMQIAGKRKTMLVFGDMLELGKSEKSYHKMLGKYISSQRIDYLIGVGKASKETVNEAKNTIKNDRLFWVDSESKVLSVLKPLINKDLTILIKGSRSVGLDRVVNALS